jgi:hypothetical protein
MYLKANGMPLNLEKILHRASMSGRLVNSLRQQVQKKLTKSNERTVALRRGIISLVVAVQTPEKPRLNCNKRARKTTQGVKALRSAMVDISDDRPSNIASTFSRRVQIAGRKIFCVSGSRAGAISPFSRKKSTMHARRCKISPAHLTFSGSCRSCRDVESVERISVIHRRPLLINWK